jgi:outer membrane protein assembly factor BamB
LFYALDKENGEVRWGYDIRQDGIPTEFHGDPLIADSLVVIASDGRGTGHVYAFVRETGKLHWKFPVARGVPTDLARDEHRVYAVTYHDSLLCLDLPSGQLQWSVAGEIFSRNRFSTHAPVTASKRVFFATSNHRIQVVHAETGKILWTRDFEARISSEMLLHQERLYVGTSDQQIYCLNQASGEILHQTAVETIPVSTPVVSGERIIFFLNPGGYRGGAKVLVGYGLDLQENLWRAEAATEWSSTRPYVWRENVLVGNDLGEVHAFRASDGIIQWSHDFGGAAGAMIRGIGITERVIYVGTLKGFVYAFMP